MRGFRISWGDSLVERIPILKMGDFLLVTIQVDMHDRLAIALQDDLMDRIASTSAQGVLIDISALEILDAETVVVGMRPAVAITLVELGLSLSGVRTALNVEKGMNLLQASLPLPAEESADGHNEG
jgi:rsbT antagonist protein RsbS